MTDSLPQPAIDAGAEALQPLVASMVNHTLPNVTLEDAARAVLEAALPELVKAGWTPPKEPDE